MNEHGYLEGSRHGDDLQHAARQRPDLVVRRQQLPARQGARSRSTCSTGTPTRRACRRRCTASICATCTRRTSWSSRAASRSRGVPIDLRKVKTPAFLLSTKEDHIAPWKSTYAATQIYQGPGASSCSSASGHIAGVVNPPRQIEIRPLGEREAAEDARTTGSRGANYVDGSWWPTWEKWIAQIRRRRGADARQPGDGKLKVIEDAPGSYVRVRATD